VLAVDRLIGKLRNMIYESDLMSALEGKSVRTERREGDKKDGKCL
jgi:hypothetical protein